MADCVICRSSTLKLGRSTRWRRSSKFKSRSSLDQQDLASTSHPDPQAMELKPFFRSGLESRSEVRSYLKRAEFRHRGSSVESEGEEESGLVQSPTAQLHRGRRRLPLRTGS